MSVQDIFVGSPPAQPLAGRNLTLKKPVQLQPTVFVDRDGVINHNRTDHVLSWNDFEFIEGSKKAFALLHKAGYRVVIVTNQAPIERGLLNISQLDYLHRQMTMEIRAAGGQVAAVYYCPHRPESSCNCRKPQPGLLFKAAAQLEIELSTSWFIGDYLTDVEAGLAAGCKPLLVLTGRGEIALKQWQQSQILAYIPDYLIAKYPAASLVLPVKANLLEAVEYILAGRLSVA